MVAVGLVFLVLVIGVHESKGVVKWIKDEWKKKWWRVLLWLGTPLMVAIALVVVVRVSDKPVISLAGPVPKSDIIGDIVTVAWNGLREQPSDERIRYTVEHRSTADTATSRSISTFAPYLSWTPSFEGTFEWRVRAERKEHEGWRPASAWTAWQQNRFYHNVLSRIRATSTIRLGVSRDYVPPFIFHSEERQDLDGIDIRIVEELRERLKERLNLDTLRIEYFQGIWLIGNSEGLRNSVTDFAIGETAVLPERETQYRIKFTHPYYFGQMALVTKEADPGELLQRETSNVRLTAWRDTTFAEVAGLLAGQFKESDNLAEMFQLLSEGEVDGLIDGAEVAHWAVHERGRGNYKIRILSSSELPLAYTAKTRYPIGSGIYVDERQKELLEFLNSLIDTDRFRDRRNKIIAAFRKGDPDGLD